jgi:hypothetical protein
MTDRKSEAELFTFPEPKNKKYKKINNIALNIS